MNPQLDPQVVALAKAIRKAESNDNFTARSKDGSFGAYQFIKPTWDATAKKYGVTAAWDKATPQEQNKVAYMQIKEWKDKGYNVGQIASMWNAGAGRPNAYKENLVGTNKYGVKFDTPGYAKKVASFYQAFKQGLGPEAAYASSTPSTSAPLPLPDNVTFKGEEAKKGDKGNNMFQKFIVNVLGRPAIRAGQALVGLGVEAFGSEATKQRFQEEVMKPTELPLGFGTVEGQKPFGEGGGKQLALESGKTLFDAATAGLGGAVNKAFVGATTRALGSKTAAPVVNQLLRSRFGSAVVRNTPQVGSNIAEGLLYNAGYNVLNDRGVGENAGAAGAFSAILPPVVNRAIKGLGNLTGIVTREPQAVQKAVDDLEMKYTELFTGLSPSKQKKFFNTQQANEAKNAAGTSGKPPQRILAEDGIIPRQEGNKISTLQQADEYRQSIQPLREANRAALKEAELSTVPTPFMQIEQEAIAIVQNSNNTPSVKKSMIDKIRKEFAATIEDFGPDARLTIQDDLKSLHWKQTKFDLAVPQLDRDVQYAVAKAYQKNIERVAEEAGLTEVAQLNRDIGDRLEAAKWLENLNGKAIKGSWTTKILFSLIGSTLGNSIPGKIVGAMGGDAVARLLVSNSISTPAKRMLLKNLEKEQPEAYKKIIQWMEQQGFDRDLRLQLPAPKEMGTPENPIITPAPTTYEAPAQKINQKSEPQSQRPMANATSTATIVANIPSTVPPKKKVSISLSTAPSDVKKLIKERGSVQKAYLYVANADRWNLQETNFMDWFKEAMEKARKNNK